MSHVKLLPKMAASLDSEFVVRAIAKKRHVICSTIVLTDIKIHYLLRHGIISEKDATDLKLKQDPADRAKMLVDHIVVGLARFQLAGIMNFFYDQSKPLHEELLKGVQKEKYLTKIDEEVLQDATNEVYRQFGNSRRFSENDKQVLSEVLAVKIQLHKDDWTEKHDKLKYEMKALRKREVQSQAVLNQVLRSIEAFAKAHKMELLLEIFSSKSTSEDYHHRNDDSASVRDAVQFIIQRYEVMAVEYGNAMEDRDQVLRRLGIEVTPENRKRRIDELMAMYTHHDHRQKQDDGLLKKRYNKQIIQLEDEVNRKDDMIEALQRNIRRLEKKLVKNGDAGSDDMKSLVDLQGTFLVVR